MSAIKKLNDKLIEKSQLKLVVSDALSATSPTEKESILAWAERVREIATNNEIRFREKALQLRDLGVPDAARMMLKNVVMATANKAWVDQSWARRLAIVGVVAGAAAGGSVGIATSGIGIGVGTWLLSSMGLAYIGVIIDEIEKERSKK